MTPVLRSMLTTVLALLVLAACASNPALRDAAVNFGDQHVSTTPAAARVTFSVHQKLPPGYQVQYLALLDWDTCVITLTNAAPVVNLSSPNLAATVLAGVRTAQFVFNPVTPATGYSVNVKLYRGGVAGTLVAQGTTNGLTLEPGPNGANVNVAVNNQNLVTIEPTLITGDALTSNVNTNGYLTIGSPGLPRFNGSTTGTTALGNYQEVSGIDIDTSGNVYVSDAKEGRIVAVPASGGAPSLVAGVAGLVGYTPDGPMAGAKLNVPRGLAHDPTAAGRLLFCEAGTTATDGRIRALLSGNIVTYAGGGMAAAGASGVDALSLQLNQPSGLCTDASANLFFTETGGGRLRRILAATRTISTLDTPPGATAANFGACSLDATHNVLYYAVGNVIYSLTTPAGSPGPRTTVVTLAPAQLGPLVNGPVTVTGLAADGAGLLYASVADTKNALFDTDVKTVRIPVDNAGALVVTGGRSIDVVAGNGATVAGTSNDVASRVIDGTTQNLGGSMNNLAIDTHASNANGTPSGTLYMGNVFGGTTAGYPVGASPAGIKFDAFGNAWVANSATNSVTKLAASGASLGTFAVGSSPRAVAFDAAGNAWVANGGSNNVTKLSSAGALLGTFAVGSLPGAIAIDGAGNAWVCNFNGANVTKLAPGGAVLGTFPVSNNNPSGIAFDGSGNAWVTNANGPIVDVLSPAGALLATYAVGSSPHGIAFDGAGRAWIANSSSNNVTQLTSGGVTLGTFGVGTSPLDLAIDGSNNVWSDCTGANNVTELSSTGNLVASFALGINGNNGLALGGLALDPTGTPWVTVPFYNVVVKLVAPPFAEVLQLYPPAVPSAHYGTIMTFAGTGATGTAGDGGPAVAAQLSGPTGVAKDAAGNTYIAEAGSHRVRKVDASGIITTVAGTGVSGSSGDGGPATSAMLRAPNGLVVDAVGNLYISDGSDSKVRKVDVAGNISTFAGTGTSAFGGDGGPATAALINGPSGLALDAAGNIFIADSANRRIRKVTPGGTITTVAGNGVAGFSGDGGPATAAQMDVVGGVAVDTGGNLYIADVNNQRVRKVNAAGTITTFAGSGVAGSSGDGGPATAARLNFIANSQAGLAVDGAANVYIADWGNLKVRKVDATGTITTFVGTGVGGDLGDNGPATSAQLKSLAGLMVDTSGSLYLADSTDAKIRKVF